MNREEIEMELWSYIDGTCNEVDKQRISMLIATDPVWTEAYTALNILHTVIPANLELEQPSMRFTKNVMDGVAAAHVAPPTRTFINKGIIRGIAAFFIIIIVAILGYALASVNFNTDLPSLAYPTGMHEIDIKGVFDSNFFNLVIIVNIVLGLVLVDTAIRRNQLLK